MYMLKNLILYDLIGVILFFPIVKILFKYTSINKYFINFKILYLRPKDELYPIFRNCRGTNYNLDNKQSKNDKNHYFITTWSILHSLYFFARGVVLPNFYIYHMVYSILFELLEIFHNCHDVMDILINTVFYYLGSKSSQTLLKLPFLSKMSIPKIL